MRSLFVMLALAAGIQAGDPSLSTVQVKHARPEDQKRPDETVWHCGSGTVVKSEAGTSWILTNEHVVPHGKGKIEVHVGGVALPGQWVAVDPTGADLSLVKVQADLIAAPIAEEPPAIGATVRQWGFAQAGPRKYRTGLFAGVHGTWKNNGDPVYVTGIQSDHGDSGSGVFAGDKLIGVTSTTSWAVHLPRVRQFVGTLLGK